MNAASRDGGRLAKRGNDEMPRGVLVGMGLFSSEVPTAKNVNRGGVDLKCDHCGHDRFYQGEAQLHTRTGTLFGFEAFQGSADYYVCERCRRMHWFQQGSGN